MNGTRIERDDVASGATEAGRRFSEEVRQGGEGMRLAAEEDRQVNAEVRESITDLFERFRAERAAPPAHGRGEEE
jgi:hypothetical protein